MRRPASRRSCCACSTAARTSLTPAITAESAMNSASQVFATSRASVVLPVPGGPQRIIEWRLRPSSSRRSGLPGASRCDWPMNSSRLAGRMRSASGRKALGAQPRRAMPPASRAHPPVANHASTTPAAIAAGVGGHVVRDRPCGPPASRTALTSIVRPSASRPAAIGPVPRPTIQPGEPDGEEHVGRRSARPCRSRAPTPATNTVCRLPTTTVATSTPLAAIQNQR